MTSQVTGIGKADCDLERTIRETFPPGSITGAPKIRATEIIYELEHSPRKIYTGSIFYHSPKQELSIFNVAIRSIICQDQEAEIGIGSGIVADSCPEAEWEECLLKSQFLQKQKSCSEIFTTMLWENEEVFLLDKHLNRLRNSCQELGFPEIPKNLVAEKIRELKINGIKKARLRLNINQEKIWDWQVTELDPLVDNWNKKHKGEKLSIKISPLHVISHNPSLYHKTNIRELYNKSFIEAQDKGYDEYIFTNERGEITEGCISSILLIDNDGRKFTPKLSCGLLNGTLREQAIDEGAKEIVIKLDDLSKYQIFLGNSVRSWRQAELHLS